jgi:membrane-bound metal-dependent hydrolase YbcI (DUF457 family)
MTDFWIVLIFLAFGLVATAGTRWLAAKLWQGGGSQPGWLPTIVADLIWVLIVAGAGIVARRYIERTAAPVLGYSVFVVGAVGLSLLRAFLYQRVLDRRAERPKPDWHELVNTAVHNSLYLLFAAVLYLVTAWLAGRPAQPGLFLVLFVGALLPDLDSQASWMGRLLPFISRRLEARLGHGQEWHSLGVSVLLALITAPLIPLLGWPAWGLLSLGFLAHLAVDLLAPQGVMLFWPLTRTRYAVFRGFIDSPAGSAERRMVAGLALVAIVLLLVVGVGQPPAPAVSPPSFEQSLQHYLSLRGRTLAFADVDGVWQATGRRVADRFEILNAAGQSFIMLDRYTGWVFTAGQGADDNLYLNRITVRQGAAADIKPVQVQLRDQLLSEALPTIYEMQPEPGLQHLFVSGDIVVAAGVGPEPRLAPDYSQTQLRRIVSAGGGHYVLRYLTASDLIALADVRVETADLVIVATYASPPVGPTATPLPEAPAVGGGP